MKIIIHRGTQQIGGNIIEINSEKARIIIDFGAELPDDKKTNDIKIEGVNVGKTNCDAVFLSHYHIDHIGLYKEVLTGIPIYIGKVAKEILLRQALYLKDDGITKIETFKTYEVLGRVVIKDIIVTPILIDHSAFDAYMFLIENNGKRILYTGDFRTHGFKGKALISTLKKHVSQVDLLISEGTALSRNKEACINENRIKEIAKNIYDEKKYVFVLCASTNIDRIAAFYHAIPKGRYFICDQYQKDILDIVSENSKEKTNLYNFEKIHTYGNNLDEKMLKSGFCMLVRANSYYKEIMDKFPDDTAYVYSLWQGYASKENTNISEFIKKYDFKSVHTSGHASVCDLKAVYDVVCPTLEIISIHSTKPNKLKEYYPEIKIIKLEDGEVLKI